MLTLVDAKHAMGQLDTRGEARRQVGFADRLFISKADLVDEAQLAILSDRLWRMNPRAPQSMAAFGDVPLVEVFDVGGFNLSPDLELEPKAPCGHHEHDHTHHHHHHDDDVKSSSSAGAAAARCPVRPVRMPWSGAMARAPAKGVLNMAGEDRKVIFQGVHQLMSHHVGASWQPDDQRQSRLVFIGLDLPQALMMRSLQQCVV